MSNNPKIYAHCKAGCLWETVHKSDFEKSAAYIKQYADTDGCFYLNEAKGKTYKINTLNNPSEAQELWAFDIYVIISNGETSYEQSILLPDFDKYVQSVKFCLHDITNEKAGTTQLSAVVVCDINGEREEYSTNIDYSETATASIKVVPYNNAEIECLLVNEHAEMRAKSAYEYAQEGGYTGTESEYAEQLAKIMSVAVYSGESEDI
jgi:hypothetical protein